MKVNRQDNRLFVQGINLVKKHQKQTFAQEGGIIQMEASIHISNVALHNPVTNKGERVGFRTMQDGNKVRVFKKSGEVADVK